MSKKAKIKVDRGETPVHQLKFIKPITINQSKVFRSWYGGQNLLIYGYAGTGKSFIGTYLALDEVLNKKAQRRLVIIRSAVPTRNQGFLPGTEAEKAAAYEKPYVSIVDDLFGKPGSYNRLKDTKSIAFETTSYLRGETIDNAVILVDEVQNLTDSEINTVMTRPGENSRVILCGDFRQGDLKNGESCMGKLVDTLGHMQSFSQTEFMVEDIVRSGLVKEWIMAREKV